MWRSSSDIGYPIPLSNSILASFHMRDRKAYQSHDSFARSFPSSKERKRKGGGNLKITNHLHFSSFASPLPSSWFYSSLSTSLSSSFRIHLLEFSTFQRRYCWKLCATFHLEKFQISSQDHMWTKRRVRIYCQRWLYRRNEDSPFLTKILRLVQPSALLSALWLFYFHSKNEIDLRKLKSKECEIVLSKSLK